jgi:hypothetical protein
MLGCAARKVESSLARPPRKAARQASPSGTEIMVAKKPRAIRNGRCRCCSLPAGEQARLELLYCGGASKESLSKEFGVSRFAVMRHVKNHLSQRRRAELLAGPTRVHDLANAAAKESKTLLEYFGIARSVLFNQFLAAAEANDRNGVAAIAPRLLDSLRELGKIMGELRALSGITINNNVLNIGSYPAYPELEAGLLEVIRMHPQTRQDILALLAKLEVNTAPGPNGAPYAMIEGEAFRAEEIVEDADVA